MRIPANPSALTRLSAVAAATFVAVLCVSGCSSSPDRGDRPENPFKTAAEGPGGPKSPLSDRELRQQAQELYSHARESLDNSDYTVAITRYDALIARYPFSDYSTQAELERIYAQYKSFQADEAVSAADRFLRAHPRHAYADYVMYLKGVTDFERDQNVLDAVMPNSSKRDIGNQRRAFEDFALLLQRYPNSKYGGDARRRMLYSRNRIADHELSVAQFYVTRGAYVAAAKRATDIITEYPGAPATAEALKILQRSYSRIGLDQEAKDTATVIAMNSDTVHYTDAPQPGLIKAPIHAAGAAQDVAAAPAAAPDSPAEHGLMSKFAGMFGIFDTSKPEHQHTFVIGNDGSVASSPAAAPSDGKTPAAPAQTSNLSLTVEYPPASDDAAAAVAKAPQQPQAAAAPAPPPEEKQGFFTWFAGLFSVLDFSKHEDDKNAPAPADAPAKTSSDTTK